MRAVTAFILSCDYRVPVPDISVRGTAKEDSNFAAKQILISIILNSYSSIVSITNGEKDTFELNFHRKG